MSRYVYLMGLDGGGTKSEALLVRSDGVVCGWGHCDVAEAGTMAAGARSRRVIRTVIRRAAAGLPAGARVTLHHAASHLDPADMIPPELRSRIALKASMESLPLLSMVPERMGVVALAGTGSHVSGRNSAGQQAVCDGLGPNFGDFGGASRIGLQALRAAAFDHWHPRHQTSLAPRVIQACRELDPGLKPFHLIGFFFRPRDRWQIASLARLVDEEAERGDPIARQILEQAGQNLAELVFDVADTLGLRSQAFSLIGIGSVLTRSRMVWECLRREVAEFAPRVRPARLLVPPVAGIALNALIEARPRDADRIRAQLLTSARALVPNWPERFLSFEPPPPRGRSRRSTGSVALFNRPDRIRAAKRSK